MRAERKEPCSIVFSSVVSIGAMILYASAETDHLIDTQIEEENTMTQYHIKPGKLGQKVIDTYKQIEQTFTERFLQEDESSPAGYALKSGPVGQKVTTNYQKNEDGVVGSYKKIENAYVDALLEQVEPKEPTEENGESRQ